MANVYIQDAGREHLEEDTCWCGPTLEALPNGDTLVIHNDVSEFLSEQSRTSKEAVLSELRGEKSH